MELVLQADDWNVEQNLAFLQGIQDKTDHEKQLNEVLDRLDIVQCSDEEAHALEDLVHYEQDNMYFVPDGFLEWDGQALPFHDECGQEHILLLDQVEMNADMTAFECEEACHELFASQPFDDRVSKYNDIKGSVNKRSEMKLAGIITGVGDDYATMSTGMGKVYLPKHVTECVTLEKGMELQVIAQYKGFQSSRQTAVPWRAKKVM
jgi:hypothetical protein